MNSQLQSSARVSDVDGFSRVFDEPVGDMPVRAVYVTEDVVLLCDMGVHSLEFAFHWLQMMGWSPGENDSYTNVICFLAVTEILMLEVTSCLRQFATHCGRSRADRGSG